MCYVPDLSFYESRGESAFNRGVPLSDCPHKQAGKREWVAGWKSAEAKAAKLAIEEAKPNAEKFAVGSYPWLFSKRVCVTKFEQVSQWEPPGIETKVDRVTVGYWDATGIFQTQSFTGSEISALKPYVS